MLNKGQIRSNLNKLFNFKQVSYGIKPLCILVSTATVGFTAIDRFSIVRAGLKIYNNSSKYIIYMG